MGLQLYKFGYFTLTAVIEASPRLVASCP